MFKCGRFNQYFENVNDCILCMLFLFSFDIERGVTY